MDKDVYTFKDNNNFYIRYNPLIRKIVTRILNNAGQSQDIDDCVNTVFLELMERLRQYSETRGSIAAFITVITRSVTLDFCKGSRNKKSELVGDENIDFMSEPIEFENEVEFGMLVESIVEKLTEPESVLFTMKYILFYPADDIAKALNIKRNAVDARVNRLKKRIKVFLAKGEITI